MVKNRIKVYARLKKEIKQNEELFLYEIKSVGDSDVVTIYADESLKCEKRQYRFDKVFDTHSSQGELFDIIAKPVINGALKGFNGTIFAYGPTGSGKTYCLTGSRRKYHRRGLIPRTIEYIFKSIAQATQNYVIYISYLEIYNEIAYDLLNQKTNVSSLEELPRIVLLEDDKGQAHFKNLSVRVVSSEEEAMRLLFLGDTNRTIAETPMNDCSSRSHCIFTIHVTTYGEDSARMSKLNLVDLAGSERLRKTGLNGITLHEAKYINLSLHYLEQVILALSESRRAHVPFRNSIMTFMLRDSISGNCMSAMLATIGTSRSAIEEALTTCKFAQRVSMVKTNVTLNREINPRYEIKNLKQEIVELKRRLLQREEKENLSKSQVEDCKKSVKNYIAGSERLKLDDLRKIKLYVQLLREEIRKRTNKEILAQFSDMEIKYKEIIKQKDKEISLLLNINSDKKNISSKQPSDCILTYGAPASQEAAFNEFLSKPGNQKTLQLYANQLIEKHKTAIEISNTLTNTQRRILKLRKGLECNTNNSECLNRLNCLIKTEQDAYKEILLNLQNVKNEMEYIKHRMEVQKHKLLRDFKKCGQKSLSSSTSLDYNTISENQLPIKVSSTLLERDDNIPLATVPNILQASGDRSFNIYRKLNSTLHANNVSKAKDSNIIQASTGRGVNINVKLSETHEASSESFNHSGRGYYNKEKLSPKINAIQVSNMSIDCGVRGFNGKLNQTINEIPLPVTKNSSISICSSDRGFNINEKLDVLLRECEQVESHFRQFGVPDKDVSYKGYEDNEISCIEDGCDSNKEIEEFQECIKDFGNLEQSPNLQSMFDSADSKDFREFLKTIPLTGDHDIDEEIVKFYRTTFKKSIYSYEQF